MWTMSQYEDIIFCSKIHFWECICVQIASQDAQHNYYHVF